MVDKTRRKVIRPDHVGVKLILAFFSSPHAGYVPFFVQSTCFKCAVFLSTRVDLWRNVSVISETRGFM